MATRNTRIPENQKGEPRSTYPDASYPVRSDDPRWRNVLASGTITSEDDSEMWRPRRSVDERGPTPKRLREFARRYLDGEPTAAIGEAMRINGTPAGWVKLCKLRGLFDSPGDDTAIEPTTKRADEMPHVDEAILRKVVELHNGGASSTVIRNELNLNWKRYKLHFDEAEQRRLVVKRKPGSHETIVPPAAVEYMALGKSDAAGDSRSSSVATPVIVETSVPIVESAKSKKNQPGDSPGNRGVTVETFEQAIAEAHRRIERSKAILDAATTAASLAEHAQRIYGADAGEILAAIERQYRSEVAKHMTTGELLSSVSDAGEEAA